MPYDEDLVNRLRAQLAGVPVTEKKMFGGLAFLVNGHMTVAASHTGGLLARVDPDEGAELVADAHVAPMEMRGRRMEGWLRVEPEAVAADDALETWVRRSLGYVRTLPPK